MACYFATEQIFRIESHAGLGSCKGREPRADGVPDAQLAV
jgi:hypothetical protein